MENCFRCGISGDVAKLSDAISDNEIVRVCEECAPLSGLPLLSKPIYESFKPEKRPSVYERLSKMSGNKELTLSNKQETTLSGIIEKKVREKIQKENKPQVELIDNFHWVILRVRRSRHITQKQLAEAISEPESSIKLIEQGKFPVDSYRLVNKLEQYLDIRIRKDDNLYQEKPVQKEVVRKFKSLPEELDFKSREIEKLNISDLKEIKKRKEEDLERRKMEEAKKLEAEKLEQELKENKDFTEVEEIFED